MISAKKLIEMAKKWQKLAASKRKGISLPRTTEFVEAENCSTSSIAKKGYFVVYTADQRRFMIPLNYLKNDIIRELLAMAEDKFGLPSTGPITLPCEAAFMEYAVVSLIQRRQAKDVEKELLMSLATCRRLPSLSFLQHQQQSNQQSLVWSF